MKRVFSFPFAEKYLIISSQKIAFTNGTYRLIDYELIKINTDEIKVNNYHRYFLIL